MDKKRNTVGGGSKTTLNGLKFENDNSFIDVLQKYGFIVVPRNVTGKTIPFDIYDQNKNNIGLCVPKHTLYSQLLQPQNIQWDEHISKQLLPDDVFYNRMNNIVYIFEKKFQSDNGSVDEKLQTCDFKLFEYSKLFSTFIPPVHIYYIYILSDFFNQPKYSDVMEYIRAKNCFYFFENDTIPSSFLGLK